MALIFWIAPLVRVRMFPTAPILTVCEAPEASKVREFTARVVRALLQSSSVLAMPRVVKSVLALLLVSARTVAVVLSKRVMVPPLI